MNRLIEVWLIFLFPVFLFCQSEQKVKHFNTSNSPIPSDLIYCIEVDSSNNKWIGTDKGLSKFDGKYWTNFNITNGLFSNNVFAIAFDKNGDVWIIDSVLSKYDGIKWTHYSEPGYLNVPLNSRHLIIDSEDIKWLVKNNRTLVSFNDTVFTNHVGFNILHSINCSENNLWICADNKIFRYTKGVLTDCSWDKNTNKNILLYSDGLQIDSRGDKWILGHIVSTGPGDAFTEELHLYQLSGIDDYKKIEVSCVEKYSYPLLLRLEHDIKWIGVLFRGLVRLTPYDCTFYDHANDSLVTQAIGIIAVDKHGNKWMSPASSWYHTGISVFNENGIIFSSETKDNDSPMNYKLEQNYPNPFNQSTLIKYSIPKAGFVSLIIYDLLGKEIATLVNEYHNIGNYEIEFNASNMASGVYFYTLNIGYYSDTKSMILLK